MSESLAIDRALGPRDLERMLADALAANRRLVHAAELQGVKVWPVAVYCDGKCGAVVAFDPVPEEAALAEALRALRWQGHTCPRCSAREAGRAR